MQDGLTTRLCKTVGLVQSCGERSADRGARATMCSDALAQTATSSMQIPVLQQNSQV